MPLITTGNQSPTSFAMTSITYSSSPSFITSAVSSNSPKDFTWAGCSDNVKYAHIFTRKFIDSTDKQRMDARLGYLLFCIIYIYNLLLTC